MHPLPTTWSKAEIDRLIGLMTPAEKREMDLLLGIPVKIWIPLPGPQTMAYESRADVIGYGGAAGGGKTDLALGKALINHSRIAVFRRNGTEHTAFVDRLEEVIGAREGYNGQTGIWRLSVDGRKVQIELGSVPNIGDERKYRGRPHDLKVFDEAAEIPEQQVRFLMGWMRTTVKGQRCQTLMCFNPPTTSEGRWIIAFFAPWLDPNHPCPAAPGELRWFGMVNGIETELPDERQFVVVNEQISYEFDRETAKAADIITPQSRTFIPARVADNPYLMGTSYMTTLQALPEPLRSQMLYGDFQAGMTEDPWQVIPSAWVDLAMSRWQKRDVTPRMDSMGVDVARGGADNTVIGRRHGMWFDEPLVYKGKETPDGPSVAGIVVANLRDAAPIHIDVIGVGASPYDFLRSAKQQVIGVNVAEKTERTDKSGRLRFPNQRSAFWWAMREALDPKANNGIALPPDPRLRADLTAPRWELRGPLIVVESREDLLDPKRLGRSPDFASAYILALLDTPRVVDLPGGVHDGPRREHNPYASNLTNARPERKEHDPYA